MTDGGGRDEKVHGSGHAGVYILCEAGRPTNYIPWEGPENTLFTKAIRIHG